MKRRIDFGNDADAYFNSLHEPVSAIAQGLRDVVLKAVPDAIESLKWGMPVYEKNGLICAIRVSKGYVALLFYDSRTTLKDPDGLLEGTGKRMRHVKVRSMTDIKKRQFTSWIRQAAG